MLRTVVAVWVLLCNYFKKISVKDVMEVVGQCVH